MPKEFLCIGGPKNGQRLSWDKVSSDYWQFNSAASIKEIPSCVFVHESVLNFTPKPARAPRKKKLAHVDLHLLDVERVV